METKGSNRLKFAKLCLSKPRSDKNGESSSLAIKSSQISKFFPQTASVSKSLKSNGECCGLKGGSESVIREDESANTKLRAHSSSTNVTERRSERKCIRKVEESAPAITKFFSLDKNESLSEFETPSKIRRKAPKFTIKRKTTAKTGAKTSKQSDIRSTITRKGKKNVENLDEEEQIKLALALSVSDADKQAEIRASIERFAHKGAQSNFNAIFGIPAKAAKGNVAQKWKTRFTALTRRSEQMQNEKQKGKVDELLLDNILIESRLKRKTADLDANCDFLYEIYSPHLQKICLTERILFEINRCEVRSSQQLLSYYTNNLVEVSSAPAGALLKDWSLIPGRDEKFDGMFAKEPAERLEANSIKNDEKSELDEREWENNLNVFGAELTGEESPKSARGDVDVTIIVQSNEIETRLNEINTQIRLSQNFGRSPSDISMDGNTQRCPSPDLFDDIDEFLEEADSEEILPCSSKSNQSVEPTAPVALDDCIVISDSNSTVMSNSEQFKVNEEMTSDKILSQEEINGLPIVISDESCPSSPKAFMESLSARSNEENDTESSEKYDDLEFNQTSHGEPSFSNLGPSQDNFSQDSIVISDDEVNYSMHDRSRREVPGPIQFPDDDYDFGGIDEPLADDVEDKESELVNQSVCDLLTRSFALPSEPSNESPKLKKKRPNDSWKKSVSEQVLKPKLIDHCNKLTSFTQKASGSNRKVDVSNDKYIIQIGPVPSKPNYENMDLESLQEELQKFGLKKSLRRRQAVIVLDYIYNRTHPYVENSSIPASNSSRGKTERDRLKQNAKEPEINFNVGFSKDDLVDAKFNGSSVERCFLPSCPRSKRPWCLQPLHIAWHNLIKANSELFNAVLNYAPINLRELKAFFKSVDMNFDNKDLIAFLDKHCVTFKTDRKNH